MFTPDQQRENPLLSITLNIVIPSLILMRFSGEQQLGAVNGLLLALAFPLAYGGYDLLRQRRVNLVALLGLLNVLLTGGIGLLQLDVFWVQVKEAAIPAVFGCAVLLSLRLRAPLAQTFFGAVLDMPRIEAALQTRQSVPAFERLMRRATLLLAGSFFLSALLNYILASLIVVSPAGTSAFNAELGRMTALSLPVIAVPLVLVLLATVWYVVRGVRDLTGLELADLLLTESNEPPAKPGSRGPS